MKIYHKIMFKTKKSINDIQTDKIHLINIPNIDILCEYVGLLYAYASDTSLKFVLSKATNHIHMITFDNVFVITHQKLKELKELEKVVIVPNQHIVIEEWDGITKYENDNYYTYIDTNIGAKYIISYETYERVFCEGAKMLTSEWYVQKEGDEDSVHVLTIYANYKCDEDEGVYNKKASQEYCDVLHRVLKHEENIGSDFYTYYCSMNTCT